MSATDLMFLRNRGNLRFPFIKMVTKHFSLAKIIRASIGLNA